MTHPLDMKDTIDAYKSIVALATTTIDRLLSASSWDEDIFKENGVVISGNEHLLFSESEIYKLLSNYPEPFLERMKLSGIFGKPEQWFKKNQDDKQIPTTSVKEAISPTAIIPSYIGFDESLPPKVEIYGLDTVLDQGIINKNIGRIIQAEGILHEAVHGVNWLGRKQAHDSKYSSPELLLQDKSLTNAYDFFVEFENFMKGSSPISHYSSFFWSNAGKKFESRDIFKAIDEELAESVAAYVLGFVVGPDGQINTDPFKDRPKTVKFIENYLHAKLVKNP